MVIKPTPFPETTANENPIRSTTNKKLSPETKRNIGAGNLCKKNPQKLMNITQPDIEGT